MNATNDKRNLVVDNLFIFENFVEDRRSFGLPILSESSLLIIDPVKTDQLIYNLKAKELNAINVNSRSLLIANDQRNNKQFNQMDFEQIGDIGICKLNFNTVNFESGNCLNQIILLTNPDPRGDRRPTLFVSELLSFWKLQLDEDNLNNYLNALFILTSFFPETSVLSSMGEKSVQKLLEFNNKLNLSKGISTEKLRNKEFGFLSLSEHRLMNPALDLTPKRYSHLFGIQKSKVKLLKALIEIYKSL